MTIALCFLTWNELEGCKHDIPQFDRRKFDNIICVDGGSTDGTVEYLESVGIPVVRQSAPGLNQATKDAVEHCGCDYCVFYHPKGSVPVSDAYRFRGYFQSGYDLVVASRMMRASVNEEDDSLFRPRKWFVLSLALVAKLLFKREGNTIWDVLHGFRGVNTTVFRALEISDFSPSVDIETVCRAYKMGIKRIEFPTSEKKRISGETHFKPIKTGSKLIKYIIREICRRD